MDTRQRILVVDDTPTNVVVLAKSLEREGYEVLTAADGFEAVDIATDQIPDLILLDMMMPGRDGEEVCTILKSQESTASIPIIFVTARTETEKVVKAFSLGGADYITKPIRVKEVLARVSVHLRLRQAETNLVESNRQLTELASLLADTNGELAQQARCDTLTGLLNRGALEESAQLEHERSTRYEHGYAVLMIDLDHFKALNDSQGHPAGDECLRKVSQCVASACRRIDLVGRYGGEEFIVVLPETDLDRAVFLAERIRTAIWDLAMPHSASPAGRVTASIGVGVSGTGSFESVVKTADAALYRAKAAGRNVVHSHRRSAPALTDPSADSLASASAPEQDAPSDGRMSVLIVDDNATSRALCKGCLARDGYHVVEAVDGLAALAAVERAAPDVIIMDIRMPKMDGLECVRALKGNPRSRDIPVIIVSGNTGTGDIVAGLKAGADEYLSKPIRTAELILRVGSMAHLSRERRDLLRSYQLRAEQIRVLTLLLDLCRSLSAATDVDEVLEHTIRAVAEIAVSRRISIMLPDAKREFLTIARSIGIDQDIARSVKIPIGRGIAGKVFESQRPIVLNSEEDAGATRAEYESEFFASVPLFAAPLGTTGETLAVLNVTERVGASPYQPHELEYIELISNIAGATLHSLFTRQARDEARDLIMTALAKLAEHRDNDTARHVERVTQYSRILAEELQTKKTFGDEIDGEFIRCLTRAVPLHDIGKVAIPDSILQKPGRLTIEEMRIMQTHASIGADTLRPILERTPNVRFLVMAVEIIHGHHEWYDGTGYPRKAKGDEIPLPARIAALADVYDALATQRVYKEAFSHAKSAAIIVESSGTQFDPRVVEAFLARESEFARLATELTDNLALNEDPSQIETGTSVATVEST